MQLIIYLGIAFQCDMPILETIYHATRDWSGFQLLQLFPEECVFENIFTTFSKSICDRYQLYSIQFYPNDKWFNFKLSSSVIHCNYYDVIKQIYLREVVNAHNSWELLLHSDLTGEMKIYKNGFQMPFISFKSTDLKTVKQKILEHSWKLLM